MPLSLGPFADLGLDASLLRLLLSEHTASTRPRLERLWGYYRNPARSHETSANALSSGAGARRPRLAQEAGLPARLTGPRNPAADDRDARREIVIENDIAWRIQSMVDFMFGRPVQIVSTAADPALRAIIEQTLDAAWESSGGIGLLQDMALLGHVYGHVDLALRQSGPFSSADPAEAAAESLRIGAIEPTRGLPVLSPSDYRQIDAYIIHFSRALNRTDRPGALQRLLHPGHDPSRARSTITEIHSARWRQVYEQTSDSAEPRLIDSAPNSLTPGTLPFIHIQNISQPFRYEGQGEVEPLIPLQDELNTRLSDRASRVTLQSFKMYLAKGLSGFEKGPVGPGQIWSTDNPDAEIQAFGGDAASPSEEAHIEQVREAMDKTSALPPLASGVVRARIGNLSSANALRITLMGTLAKTARKRITYGRGIAEMSRLILHALDHAGILHTDPRDRNIRLVWADPIPEDTRDRVADARAKLDLGIAPDRILAELGYGPSDPGVV